MPRPDDIQAYQGNSQMRNNRIPASD